MRIKTQVATVAALASAALLAFSPSAQANWSGSIDSAQVNWESKRWQEELYSQITFHNCLSYGTSPVADSTDVQMWRVINLQPDDSYDKKTYTACFKGSVSNGEWTDLPSGKKDYYFQIMEIGNETSYSNLLDVGSFVVDTTKADG